MKTCHGLWSYIQSQLIKVRGRVLATLLLLVSSTSWAEPDDAVFTTLPLQQTIILQDTAELGTATAPTMDGGIINLAGSKIVQHTVPTVNNLPQQRFLPTMQGTNVQQAKSWVTTHEITPQASLSAHIAFNQAINSGKLPFVVKLAAAQHLPVSIALIPMVESHYQDNAISPKGAQGAWQLMPQTARLYHVSDPKSFESATKAAITMLKNLYTKFGNWDLVFAAYNAGEVRVSQAIAKKPQATAIEELDLPLETKQYVEKIHALQEMLIDKKT